MTHLTHEQMIEFIEAPEDPQVMAIRDHVVSCSQCRNKMADIETTLTQLRERHASLSSYQTSGIDPIQLADYFAGTLSTQVHAQIKAALAHNPQLTKEALHFLTHDAAMNRSVADKVQPETAPPETAPNMAQRLLTWLNSWQLPVWQPVSASVALVFVLGLLINFGSTDVMQFQTDSGLYWQTPQPGMGFFQLATAERSDYDGVSISQNEQTLMFDWPAVDGVSDYRFELQTLSGGRIESLGEQVVQATQTEVAIDQFIRGKHYEWVLSGLADDGKAFQARGGFVLMTSGN
jgi:hypothetical protein